MDSGVNGVAVECSAIGALRKSGTWCCISVEKRIGLTGTGEGSVLMSSWISVLPGFLRGSVFDLRTISARLVLIPLPGRSCLGSGALTGFITLPVLDGGGTTLPDIERPLLPNGTGGLRMPEDKGHSIISHSWVVGGT